MRERFVGETTASDRARGVRFEAIRGARGREEKECIIVCIVVVVVVVFVRVQARGGYCGRPDGVATVRESLVSLGTENTERVDRTERERDRGVFRGV